MLAPGPMKQGTMGRKRQTSSLTPSQPLGGERPPHPCCAGPCPSCLGACYLFWLPLSLFSRWPLQPIQPWSCQAGFKHVYEMPSPEAAWLVYRAGPGALPHNEQWHSQLPEVQGKHFSCCLLSLSNEAVITVFQRWTLSADNVPNFPRGRPWKCQEPDSAAQPAQNQPLGDCRTKGVFLPVLQPSWLPGHATCSVTESCTQKRPALGFISLHLKLALHNTEKNSKICADNSKL